jgi:hypothetical protein
MEQPNRCYHAQPAESSPKDRDITRRTALQHDWLGRFEQFAARKTRLAATASLPPYRTELEAPDANALALGNAWTKRLFDGLFYLSPAATALRPACSLVFVQSSDGNTCVDDPGVLGGGNTDTHLVYEGLSRVAADAVLAGARTVRGSDVMFSVWHPQLVDLRMSLELPRHPAQIVATLRGLDLADTMLFNLPAVRVLLLTIASAAEQMSRHHDQTVDHAAADGRSGRFAACIRPAPVHRRRADFMRRRANPGRPPAERGADR